MNRREQIRELGTAKRRISLVIDELIDSLELEERVRFFVEEDMKVALMKLLRHKVGGLCRAKMVVYPHCQSGSKEEVDTSVNLFLGFLSGKVSIYE